MPSFDVWVKDEHGDDREEDHATVTAYDAYDAAVTWVADSESEECSYPIGEGRDTERVFVRETGSGHDWQGFIVGGQMRPIYTATPIREGEEG